MQNFSPLALKLREELEDDRQTYCKNAKFQPMNLLSLRGINSIYLVTTE